MLSCKLATGVKSFDGPALMDVVLEMQKSSKVLPALLIASLTRSVFL